MAIKKEETKKNFALQAQNFKLMIVGYAIVILGFALMLHAPEADPNALDETIYGFRCTVLAPMTVLLGFVFEIYAIMKRPSKTQN